MRSLLLLIPFLLAGLTLNAGCLSNFGGDDEEESSTSEDASSDEKEVPGRDDNSGNASGNDRASNDVRTESGSLSAGDRTLDSGEYADLYNVSADQGETIVIEMTSSAFDPYLILRPPGGTQVDNDDFNGDRTRSRIEYVATQGGSFDVIATSYAVGESGDYRVTMEVGEGIGGNVTDPATAPSK